MKTEHMVSRNRNVDYLDSSDLAPPMTPINERDQNFPHHQIKHTFGHVNCPACDLLRDKMLEHTPEQLAAMNFSKASPLWLETRRRFLDQKTFYQYQRNIVHLNHFFSNFHLRDIHLGHLRTYQRARQDNHCVHGISMGIGCDKGCTKGLWMKRGGSSLINHELSIVQQLLKSADLWAPLENHYQPMPPPRFSPPKVMTDEEEDMLFAIASSRPQWEFAGWIAQLTANTTASGKELRHLQLHHVMIDAYPPRLHIPVGKNSYRVRTIALNETAQKVIRRCLDRATALGSTRPEHYLFPFRVNRGGWDATRPASSSWLRRAWEDLRAAAGLPWLTPHCMRHQAITRMAEAGIPPEVIRATAGHVSEQMMRHYCHTRLHVQSEYLAAIDPSKRKPVRGDRLGAWSQRMIRSAY